jgi:hypothetical protein
MSLPTKRVQDPGAHRGVGLIMLRPEYTQSGILKRCVFDGALLPPWYPDALLPFFDVHITACSKKGCNAKYLSKDENKCVYVFKPEPDGRIKPVCIDCGSETSTAPRAYTCYFPDPDLGYQGSDLERTEHIPILFCRRCEEEPGNTSVAVFEKTEVREDRYRRIARTRTEMS